MRTVLALMLAAASVVSLAGSAVAQDAGASASPPDRTALALARALDARLTVWRRSNGDAVHASHCRRSKSGCRARIASFAGLMAEVARAEGVDPFLIAAMAIRESGMNPFAEGAAGEWGLIQLHPRGVGSRVRFVRNESYRQRCARRADGCQREVLVAGAHLLANAVTRCGSIEEALGAYNTGTCQETGYSRRVLRERLRLVELAKRETQSPALVD